MLVFFLVITIVRLLSYSTNESRVNLNIISWKSIILWSLTALSITSNVSSSSLRKTLFGETLIKCKQFIMAYLLCKMISEILDIKNMTGRLSLIFPSFTVSIENSMAKKIAHRSIKLRTLCIIFEIVYKKKQIRREKKSETRQIILRFKICSTFKGLIVTIERGIPKADVVLYNYM